MEAIEPNRVERKQFVAYFAGGNTAQNRFDGRMALRELGAVRFSYQEQYAINTDEMVLRVSGYDS